MKRLLFLVILLPATVLFSLNFKAAQGPATCLNTNQPPVDFSLDGVPLSLCTTFIEHPRFVVSDPNNAIQIAYATQDSPDHKEILITAVRYGQQPATELLPRAEASTQEDVYRAQLRTDRSHQGGQPQAGSVLHVFGRVIAGDTSSVALFWDGIHAQPVHITEWVIKAGNRLWIIRASQPASGPGSAASIAQGNAALANTSLASPVLNLSAANNIEAAGFLPVSQSNSILRQSGQATATLTLTPTPSETETETPSPTATATITATATATFTPTPTSGPSLPAPNWWSGVCDLNNYRLSTYNPQKLSSYPLGATYRGLVACGPRPWADNAPDVLVRFFYGAWGELEWECVELSMRFMYLAYGIPPYPANGNTLVPNYHGDKLIKIPNGQPGFAPLPDDVLSYCATCTVGHTSVVSAASVDVQGNGSITVIEENNSPSGFSTLPVANWVVSGNSGPVVGWLQVGNLDYHSYLPVQMR